METKFRNVGVLDLRNTEESVFRNQYEFGNIGIVLFSKKTAPLLKYIKSENIGTSVECDDNLQLISGKSALGAETLSGIKTPLRLLVMGKLVIQDNTGAAAFDHGVHSIRVSGKIICPSDLLPIVQAKITELNGKIETYPSGFSLVEKSLFLSRAQLLGFAPGSKIAVFGDLTIDRDVSEELLKERLAGVYVKGKLFLPERLSASIATLLHAHSTTHTVVVPDGFEVIHEDSQICATDLTIWEGSKLFFAGSVRFSSEVTSSDIDKIDHFIAQGDVYCAESILPFVLKKCDRFKTRLHPYKGELLFNEGQAELTANRLKNLNGVLTIVNQGVLDIESSIPTELFEKRVDRIRNTGVIMTDDQLSGVIQSKSQGSSGTIVSSSSSDEEAGGGNVGTLKL